MRTALLIGGTGVISMSVTRLLAADEDWRVCVLNRGNRNAGLPDSVETIAADVSKPDEARRALGDRAFDVVADFIAFTPEQVERDVELFAGRTRQYVFISSASAYQKPATRLPITESTPLRNPYWQYSRDKIACEDLLTRAYRETGFPMTIVRPSHTYGYFNLPLAVQGANRGFQVLDRIRRGKPVVIPGDGSSLWVVTHADDFAVGFAGLMGNPLAVGHAFHITSDDVHTWNSIYGHIADALGVELNPFHMASDEIIESLPSQSGNLLGDKAVSATFDNAKIRAFVPAFAPRIRFADAARRIVGNMTTLPELQIPDPEFDAWCDRVTKARRRY